MKFHSTSLFLIFFCFSLAAQPLQQKADICIFSYDRPLQLYALLESFEEFVTGTEHISVIYRVSDNDFAKAYEVVKNDFAQVAFLKQGPNPKQDFKPMLRCAVFDAPNPYILFAVDDIIVTDYIDLNECIAALEAAQAYGFYLRLGKNVTTHYQSGTQCELPRFQDGIAGICRWQFKDGQRMWNYPNTVDMTLYRKKDIKNSLVTMNYANPNELEGAWSGKAHKMATMFGICYEHAKIVNVPLNCVQTVYANKHMNLLSTHKLLEIFNAGLKIDIKQLFRSSFASAHIDYVPTFVAR